MNPRLGKTLYWAGLAGAAIFIFAAIDSIWIYQSGRSLLPITGRFVSHSEMLITAGVGTVLAVVCWRAGTVARTYFSRPAGRPPVVRRPNAKK